jgi:anti-sigma factor RsiW
MTTHLSEAVMAAYVDGSLPKAERRQADAHIADCSQCREELVAVSGLVHAPRMRPATWLPLAAAASIAVVAIALTVGRPGGDTAILRGTDETAALRASQPADGAALELPARFAWLRAADALEYRVTVTDAAGGIVAERVTPDTSAIIAVLPPASYRWNVTAILGSGSVLSSGMRAFTVK